MPRAAPPPSASPIFGRACGDEGTTMAAGEAIGSGAAGAGWAAAVPPVTATQADARNATRALRIVVRGTFSAGGAQTITSRVGDCGHAMADRVAAQSPRKSR